MSKQIQVNLAFNADTAKAKQQINDLVNSLNQISNKNTQIFDDREFREAANAAKDLTKHLEAAVNVNTGKLDLNKFSQSLSQSKQSLSDLYNSLSKAGPQGQQAFLQLASSIASSESQVLNLNAKVKDLGVTLKNTVKWQLSSSLVHGFMGALQHAFGYAQDLNSSLNDIRIVTGASVEEMAKFAEQANKSAKALSSTTNEYAKASLIYYQQGLSDSEVQERTDITIKMANVSKESAQTVSDQMTAVWNNFYDGSKSLEYYADVMTALGAATASSVDEIAGGLEKFAAIGDTIGLSYEYAASALATITSNTRQSEEVVGTALKTIFARIQGLNLGETLDDGTTLNKYSAALDKVGISIFDQAGEIKNMDNILSELGNKWQDLSKDQQIALAQTVAGTRQYTQLVALMDNWDTGDNDSFMANLNTAYNSEGALQEQQEIYAESWEAAADRVTAATEDIYDSLINDEAIVVLLNGLEKVLNVVGALVDGFGGLKGILLLVAGIFSRQIANEIPEAIGKLKNNFDILTGSAQKKKVADIDKSKEIIQTNLDTGKVYKTEGDRIRAQSTIEELSALSQLEKVRSQLTDTQQKNIDKKIAERKASQQLIASIQDEIDAAEKAFKQSKRKIQTKQNKQTIQQKIESYGGNEEEWKKRQENTEKLKNKKQRQLSQNDLDYIEETEKFEQKRKELQDSVAEVGLKVDQTVAQALDEQVIKLQQLYKQQAQLNQLSEDFDSQLSKWSADGKNLKLIEDPEKQQQAFKEIQQSMKNYAKQLQEIDNLKISPKALEEFNKKIDNIGRNVNSVEDMEKAIQDMIQEFDKIESTDDNFKNLRSQIENVSSSIQMLENDIEGVEDALKALDPSLFKELQQAAEQAGTSVGELYYTLSKQKNAQDLLPKIDTSIPEMEFSTALTKVGAMGMDIMALFAELGSAITVCFDEGATAGEKFVAVLSTIPTAAMTIADIIGGLADMPKALEVLQKGFEKLPILIAGAGTTIGGFFASISGKAIAATAGIKGLGAVFTGLSAALGPVGAGIAIVAAALAALFGLFKLGESIYNNWADNDSGKQFEAAKEATEGMTAAAESANTAYQNLLNTINGYNSAVGALEGLEKGTQEFTDALINANEKAWELIEAYGLIQGQDWDYNPETGAIEINKDTLNGIQKEKGENVENINAGLGAAKINEAEKELNVAKSNVSENIANDLPNIYDALGLNDTGRFKSLMSEWENATTNLDDTKIDQIIAEVGKRYYGEDNYDSTNMEQRAAIADMLWSGENIQQIKQAEQKLDNTEKTESEKAISNSLMNEDAFQNAPWKKAILESLNEDYESVKANRDRKWSADRKTDDEVIKAFDDYLKQNNFTKDSEGKVFDQEGNEISDLSSLNADGMRNILATTDAINALEREGTKMAESFTKINSEASEHDKGVLDALINGDLSNLSNEQIGWMKKNNGVALDQDTIDSLIGEFGTEKVAEWLNDLNAQIENWKPQPFDTDSWEEEHAKTQELILGTERGENISQTDYDSLNEAAKAYFEEYGDGEWKMMGTPEEVAEASSNYDLGILEQEIAQNQKVMQTTKNAAEANSGISTDDVLKMSETGGASEEANAQMERYLQNVEAFTGLDFSSAQEAAQYMKDQSDALGDMQMAAIEACDSMGDLDDLFQDGAITQEQYDKGLQSIATKYENTNDELNDFRDALQSGDKEQIKAARNMLELATRSGELAEETEFSAEELENQAKALKNTGKYTQANGKALAEMAKDQLRWNKAVDKAKDSMDDWKKAIQKGNVAEYMDEIKEAYGNILDIDGDLLSDSFASSADNLKLMEEAMSGNEESYQTLLDMARQEIATKIGIDDAEFQTGFNDLMAKYYEGQSLDDLEVGASLDNQGFLDGLTQMVNAAGMTADQATSYLASMGVDATVKPGEPATVTDKVAQGAIATVTQVPGTASTITPDGSGGITVTDVPVSYPSISYEAGPEVEVSKQTTGVGLEVTSANKSSGGAVKNAGGGGGGSKGGGGGGGKKSEKKKVDKVKKSAVVKRYKRVDDKIDDKQNAAEKASRAMDKMYGNSRIKQMQKYNQLLQEEIGLLEAKKQEAEDYLKIDEKDLQSSLDDALKQAGFSKSLNFEIDSDGLITNYEEVMTKLWAELDRQITKANNAGGATEEQQEKIDELQAKIDAVTEAVEQYDETRELIEDIENDMAEKALELYDNQLEALSYEIELNLEVSDDSLALIEFQLSQIEDNAFKAAEAINLMGSQAATIEGKMAKTKDALASLTAMTLDGEYTQEQMDLIKQYRDELMELAQEYSEIRKAVEEQVIAAFEGWREEMDRGISTVEHAGSVLESYKNITDLLGDSISEQTQNELYSKLGEGIMNNAIDNIEATKAAYEGIQEAQARAQAEYDAAIAKGDEASAEMWKNTLNTLNEEAQAAQEAMLASWENALNAAVEQFEQSVERAVDSFREQFDDLSDKFSRQKETSDMFLDDYAKIYELSKLSRDINKTIDDTESLGGKKKLKGLLEDINKLQEDGVEMSQYDLEYLQKTYDLRLAELELENAQNAKNTVRLSKDNEGNWSYVYTTNTDAVDQAQQKYEDALYAMQDLSSNYIDEMSEKLISTSQEMADALAALRVEDFGSYQEYQDAVDAVTQEYENKLKLQEAELDKAIGNNKVLYETDWKNYSDATGYKISKTDEFVTAFRDSLLGSLMDSTTESSNFMEVLAGSAKVLVDSLGVGGKEYFTNVGAIMEAAGTSTDAFGEDATEAINATGEASKKAAEDVTSMADSMVEDFDNISDAVVSWQETYSEAITQALKDTESLVAMINAMNESLVEGNGIPLGVSVGENGQGTYSDDNDITADIIKQLVDMDLNEYDEKTLSHAMSKTLASVNVEDYDSYEEYASAIEKIQNAYTEALQNITTGQDKEQYAGEWDQLKKAISADSEIIGELIPNTLAPILAEVIDKISINAQQMSLGVGQWAAQVIKDEFIQTLEQKVDISAEFPNVSDHNEIEQALTDLINTASQYANRK